MGQGPKISSRQNCIKNEHFKVEETAVGLLDLKSPPSCPSNRKSSLNQTRLNLLQPRDKLIPNQLLVPLTARVFGPFRHPMAVPVLAGFRDYQGHGCLLLDLAIGDVLAMAGGAGRKRVQDGTTTHLWGSPERQVQEANLNSEEQARVSG